MNDEKKGAKPTERVVLKRYTISRPSDESILPPDDFKVPVEAWLPVEDQDGEPRIFHATSKKQAIEEYAGKKGKDHPGTYRAPSLSAWREEHTFKPSDEPLMVEEVKP